MAGDDLSQILELARRELDDVPDEVWARFDSLVRRAFGTQRIYIAAHRKRQHLEQLQAAADNVDTQRIAQMLGVSERRVRQLKKLR